RAARRAAPGTACARGWRTADTGGFRAARRRSGRRWFAGTQSAPDQAACAAARQRVARAASWIAQRRYSIWTGAGRRLLAGWAAHSTVDHPSELRTIEIHSTFRPFAIEPYW